MCKKKLVALLLAVAMIASMVVPGVSAEDAYTVSIVDNATGAATIDANAGEDITLVMKMSGNTGVSSVFVNIDYPEGWTVKAYQDMELFASAAATTSQFSPLTRNPFSCIWAMPTGTKTTLSDTGMKLSTQNGELFLIQFTIPADAATGTYNIDLDTTSNDDLVDGNFAYETYDDGTINPNERYNLALATEGMTINVTGNESEETPVTCPCASCNGAVPTWEEWTFTSGNVTSGGHYRLTDDVTLTGRINVKTANLCLDLNGHTLTAPTSARAFKVTGVTLTIMDSGFAASVDADGNLTGKSGKIVGGQTSSTGGAIYVESTGGALDLWSGVITDGKGTNGGNLYVYNGAKANIYGGIVHGGTATGKGGNLFANGGIVNMYGGIVTGGTATTSGGNFHCTETTEVNMYGGTITDGDIVLGGDTLKIYNGIVDFDPTTFNSDGSSALADCACVVNNGGTYTIWNYDTSCTDCDYEKALASYGDYITEQTGSHTAPEGSNDSDGWDCVYCDYVQPGSDAVYCQACKAPQNWVDWDGTADISAGGHYRMTTDVTLTSRINVKTANLCLDLNGRTLTAPTDARAFKVTGVTLSIMDSGFAASVDADGNLTGTAGKIVGGTQSGHGGTIYVEKSGTFELWSGVITSGTASSYGGNIYASASTVNIHGGIVYGGTASRGGNIYATGGTVNVDGGIIHGGTTSGEMGGNIYATSSGVFNLNGGTISGGTAATYGGNICVNSGATLTMTGGTVTGGTHGEDCEGGNLYVGTADDEGVYAAVSVYGGTITNGSVVRGNASGTLDIYNVTIDSDPTAYLCDCVLLTTNGTYVFYDTLDEALAAAVSGDKVTLGTDVETNEVIIQSGITLDLNGKTLTAGSLTSAADGACTIDSVGKGKLEVEQMDHASFMGSNGQLPVYNEGAYTFEKVTFKHKLETAETSATYKFYIDSEAAKTLIDDAILAGNEVEINVSLAWTYNGESSARVFTLDADKLELLANNWDTKMIVLSISYNEGVEITDCTAQVVSGGVTVEATTQEA